MPRFFRRLSEGVFDEADLRVRSAELARFVGGAAEAYGFDPGSVVAVGFSNGANIAASLLILHPEVLAGAVLFRAMVPLRERPRSSLDGVRVLLSEGLNDPIVPRAEGEELARMLEESGATVRLEWQEAGHGLVQGDIDSATAWLGESG